MFSFTAEHSELSLSGQVCDNFHLIDDSQRGLSTLEVELGEAEELSRGAAPRSKDTPCTKRIQRLFVSGEIHGDDVCLMNIDHADTLVE